MSAGPLVPRRGARLYLAAEFTALFVALPVALYFARHQVSRWIIPFLLVTCLPCLILLFLDRDFDRRRLWNTAQLGPRFLRLLRVFLPGALALSALVYFLLPDLWLALPRRRPLLWSLVLLGYPIFSVYPQELIFRAFLFHRYRLLFPEERARVLASGLAFGLAHLFFANWIAPLLGTLGGLLFARTYARTESTLQACLEHALWGDLLFTIGLGWYFYGGSVR